MSEPAERKDKRPESVILAEKGLREALLTRSGRAFLWSLLESAGVFRISAVLSEQSPSPTFFREGERNNGNRLMTQIIDLDLEGYLLMQREAYLRGKNSDGRRERQRAAEHGQPAEERLGGDGDGSTE